MTYEARIETPSAQPVPAPMVAADELDLAHEDRASARRVWLIIAAAAVLLIALWFFVHRNDASGDAGDVAQQAATVTVVVPGRATIAGAINATGTLAARRDEPIGSVGEGGQVVDVRVEAGDWVRQGQVLAVIDRSVQNQQQASQAAQVQVAVADARLAQANLERALKLVERGFISKADIDRLTATRDAANARVNVARATLGQLQAQAARLNIVAPSDGLVLERRVERGQVVGGGAGILFRLARGGELELQARLSETDLAALSPGVSAEVTPVGSPRSFTGQVWQISPVIDATTRQGTARIALAYAPELRPGGFASVVIRAGTVVAPKLPESAILSDNAGSYVYVVGPGNKVVRRPVKTGVVTADGIAVVEGLTGTERVVLRAGGFLQPGETVNPQLAAAAKQPR
ncbi:efflux RND transporter periplasmic adaptor subunit [Novosphingobium piscinae]|uniref:Efflux RND transporter periplasmic adaptor subunit n=1 Tax=Novosphingobium piscinae TaxID=1507448 RepID=A0A7X1KRH3_9SPHN|nr:efflux RND transporter periplasmic adaptor subunit [Novosphingobium piscinae]MBC2670814.1 efflux RND transporter periplasmic adaptor subunit [Novosphingobium piscinae]